MTTKKLIFLISFTTLIFLPKTSYPCDICGCGVGGGFLGVLPQFQKNLVGYRYFQNRFYHPPTDLNQTDGVLLLYDAYHVNDLWMRYYLTEKTQLFTFIPYRVHTRRYEDGTVNTISGIGDIQLNVLQELINQSGDPNRLFRHIWFMGGGVRIPSGQYMQRDPKRRMYPLPFQVGTGAWTFQLQNLYILRYKNFGIQSDFTFRHSLPNELEYRVGNIIQTGGNAFYWWQLTPHLAILPIIGFQHEYSEMDTEYGFLRTNTGGSFGFVTSGIDVYYRRVIFQTFTQIPVFSAVGGPQPSAGVRLGAGVALFW